MRNRREDTRDGTNTREDTRDRTVGDTRERISTREDTRDRTKEDTRERTKTPSTPHIRTHRTASWHQHRQTKQTRAVRARHRPTNKLAPLISSGDGAQHSRQQHR